MMGGAAMHLRPLGLYNIYPNSGLWTGLYGLTAHLNYSGSDQCLSLYTN